MPRVTEAGRTASGFHPRVAANPDCLNAGVWTYALHDGTAVKIGKCAGHPQERLKDLQTGNPRPLTLLAYTTTVSEARAHKLLAPWRLNGEWFRVSLGVLGTLGTWDWCNTAELARLTRQASCDGKGGQR
jgi:T5orf172 domain